MYNQVYLLKFVIKLYTYAYSMYLQFKYFFQIVVHIKMNLGFQEHVKLPSKYL